MHVCDTSRNSGGDSGGSGGGGVIDDWVHAVTTAIYIHVEVSLTQINRSYDSVKWQLNRVVYGYD